MLSFLFMRMYMYHIVFSWQKLCDNYFKRIEDIIWNFSPFENGRSVHSCTYRKGYWHVHVMIIFLSLKLSKWKSLIWTKWELTLSVSRSFARPGRMVQNRTCWWASCTVGLPKQRQVHCFGSHTVQLAHQHVWFCTMWPGCTKGLFRNRKPDVIIVSF